VTPRPNDCDAPTASSCTAEPLVCFKGLSGATFGGNGAPYLSDIGLDAYGGVQLAGIVASGTLELGAGSTLLGGVIPAAFAARLDPLGGLLWARAVTGVDESQRMVRGAFAPDGSVALVGVVTATTNLDLTHVLDPGAFVVLYGPTGDVAFAHSLGDPKSTFLPAAVALTSAGEVIVAGTAWAGSQWALAPGTPVANWQGGSDIGVIQYAATGEVNAFFVVGSPDDDDAFGMLAEPDGTLDIAGMTVPDPATSCASSSVVITRLDAAHDVVFQTTLNSFDHSSLLPASSFSRAPVVDLARDSAGELAVSIDAPASVLNAGVTLRSNGVLALLDSAGQELWQRVTLPRGYFGRVAFDARDHLVVSGWYWEAQDFGLGALAPSTSSIGDAFFAKFDRSGHALTSVGFPSEDALQYMMPFAIRPDDGLTVGSSIGAAFSLGGVALQSPSTFGGTTALFVAMTTP
jgi:hypothetical protein